MYQWYGGISSKIMNFLALITNRHSCRQFDGEPIEISKLDYIKSAMMTAPSAGNLQAYSAIIVRHDETRRELANAAFADKLGGQSFLYDVPLFMVFFADPERNWQKYGSRGELYAIQDATIACTYAQLAATDVGLDSVWIGAFLPGDVNKALNISSLLNPVAILAMGHSKSKHLTSPIKSDRVIYEI